MGTGPLLVNERLEKALGDSLERGITGWGSEEGREGEAVPRGMLTLPHPSYLILSSLISIS